MQHAYPRIINFESVSNFRDLGGYQTLSGYMVAWRKLFRSGDPCKITESDFGKIRDEIKIKSLIDLRSNAEIEQRGRGLLSEANIRYYSVSFIPDAGVPRTTSRYQGLTNMGERYLQIADESAFYKGIIEALQLIAETDNHPVLFYCFAGKDRSGMLAAILLSILGVARQNIIADYCLSTLNAEVIARYPGMPDWFYKTESKSMEVLLTGLDSKYGSIRSYLLAKGADSSLFSQLEKALVV